jgi:hypothetical protein
MKNNLLLLLAITVGCLTQNNFARAQILINGDFEGSSKPVGTGKVTTGFATIPGWKDIGTAANNSGVQYGAPGDALNSSQAGSYFAFQDSDDSNGANRGAYQITNTVLHPGDKVTLTWYAVNTTGTPTQNVNLLAAPAKDATFDAATVLQPNNTPALGLNATYTQYTITYTATAADEGKYLGVSFSTTGANNSFVQYDSFMLTDVAASK